MKRRIKNSDPEEQLEKPLEIQRLEDVSIFEDYAPKLLDRFVEKFGGDKRRAFSAFMGADHEIRSIFVSDEQENKEWGDAQNLHAPFLQSSRFDEMVNSGDDVIKIHRALDRVKNYRNSDKYNHYANLYLAVRKKLFPDAPIPQVTE